MTKEMVILASGALSRRERMVMRGFFGIECKKVTLADMARNLELTYERVKQIRRRAEKKILEKIHKEETPDESPPGDDLLEIELELLR